MLAAQWVIPSSTTSQISRVPWCGSRYQMLSTQSSSIAYRSIVYHQRGGKGRDDPTSWGSGRRLSLNCLGSRACRNQGGGRKKYCTPFVCWDKRMTLCSQLSHIQVFVFRSNHHVATATTGTRLIKEGENSTGGLSLPPNE